MPPSPGRSVCSRATSAASTPKGAGCYGHNGADDVAFDAAMLARAVNGRPVRLQWMRDDEFKWEPYGPAMTMKVKGAVAGGRVVDWAFDVWSQSHNMRPGDPDGINLLSGAGISPMRSGPGRRAMPRSRTVRATATPSRSTISRASAPRTT